MTSGNRDAEVLGDVLDRRAGVDPDRVDPRQLIGGQHVRRVRHRRAATATAATRRTLRRRAGARAGTATGGLGVDDDAALAGAGAALAAHPATRGTAGLARGLGLRLVALGALGRLGDRDDPRTRAGRGRLDVRDQPGRLLVLAVLALGGRGALGVGGRLGVGGGSLAAGASAAGASAAGMTILGRLACESTDGAGTEIFLRPFGLAGAGAFLAGAASAGAAACGASGAGVAGGGRSRRGLRGLRRDLLGRDRLGRLDLGRRRRRGLRRRAGLARAAAAHLAARIDRKVVEHGTARDRTGGLRRAAAAAGGLATACGSLAGTPGAAALLRCARGLAATGGGAGPGAHGLTAPGRRADRLATPLGRAHGSAAGRRCASRGRAGRDRRAARRRPEPRPCRGRRAFSGVRRWCAGAVAGGLVAAHRAQRVALLHGGGCGLHVKARGLELVENVLAGQSLLLGDLMDSLFCHAVVSILRSLRKSPPVPSGHGSQRGA